MNQFCDLASTQGVKDDRWRRHAADCPDCRELLAVSDSLTSLAARTVVPRELPAPGYLLLKARVRQKQAAVDRADRPIYAMIAFTGILFAAVTGGVLLGLETHYGSAITDAFRLLASYAGVIIFGGVVVAIVSATASYFVERAKA